MGWLIDRGEKEMSKNSEPTTALETLGTYLSGDEPRDAIHLAVVPLVATEKVFPSQHLTADGQTKGETVGIVDPFLPGPVQPGQRFWLVLYPRTITSLRHVWTHPAFPEQSPINRDEEWIRNFADSVGLGYQTIMDGAREWVQGREEGGWGEYLNFGGLLEGESVPDEFWDHYDAITGRPTPEEYRGSFFTCSC